MTSSEVIHRFHRNHFFRALLKSTSDSACPQGTLSSLHAHTMCPLSVWHYAKCRGCAVGYNTVSVLTLLTGWSVIRARQTSSKPRLHASPVTAGREAATRTQKGYQTVQGIRQRFPGVMNRKGGGVRHQPGAGRTTDRRD